MRITRGMLAVASLCTVVVLIAGCAQKISGQPTAALEKVRTDTVAGLPVNDSPDGPKPDVKQAALKVNGGVTTPEDKLAVNALSDVFDYWSSAMPANFGGAKFTEPKAFNSYDSRSGGHKICGQDTKNYANAFYCRTEKSVSWDRGALLPLFDKQFGPSSIATVLAHEMGHAVQYQLGTKSGVDANTPTIVTEQQADCYAGNFFRWAAEGHAKHFSVATGAGLNRVLSALLFIRDPAGGQSAAAPGAHGTAFDRIYAFQTGFAEPPTACAAIDESDVNKRTSERLLRPQEQRQNGGNIQIESALPMLKASLDKAFERSQAPSPRFVPGNGTCTGNTPPVSYCTGDNQIDIDMSKLTAIGNGSFPTGTVTDMADKPVGGDFSAFAEIASRYTLAVQRHAKLPITGERAGLRSACLTGAWSAYTNERRGSGKQLRLAAGDLDEAIAEMLRPDSVIADDVAGNGVDAGFARVEAFRIGFMNGSAQCAGQFS